MKLNISISTITLKNLQPGNVFKDGPFYLLLSDETDNGKYIATDLDTGEIHRVEPKTAIKFIPDAICTIP